MLHRIKSYVRRTGRMTLAQQRALQQLWPKYGLDLSSGQLDFSAIFGNSNSVILEIGFGMGQVLQQLAKANPTINYIGIEVHQPGVGSLLSALEREQLTNVRVFCDDAIDVLINCIPNASLQQILIFFPDPWPKKRHHKRRLIQSDFIALLRHKLVKNGFLHLATDWQNYAEQMLEVMAQSSAFDRCDDAAIIAARPPTKFEQRGLKLGHKIWDLVYRLV